MAAGDRNKNGRATDIVCHFVPFTGQMNRKPICGQKRWGYGTSITDEVDCKKCLAKLKKENG